MEEETRYCDFCGAELDEDEGTWVNDELLCDDCCDEHTITCDQCGESVWTNDCVTDDIPKTLAISNQKCYTING